MIEARNALSENKVRAIADYVIRNLDRSIPVSELAAMVNISRFHFSRQFRSATGFAPHQYVLRCRMGRAAQLLIDTEMSVCAVAVEVGCVDQSHFANTFRRTFGCTPGKFRRFRAESARDGHEPSASTALVPYVQRSSPGDEPSALAALRLGFHRGHHQAQVQPT